MRSFIILLLSLLFIPNMFGQQVWITGYMDSSCPQAKGRTLEIYVSGNLNMAGWKLMRQSNGNGYTTSINLSDLGTLNNQFAYITNDSGILMQEFDTSEAKIIQTGAINDNGDDAFLIVDSNDHIIDQFGEEFVQPSSSSPWYHRKTYYYRKDGASPNEGNFNSQNWTFGEIDLLVNQGLCNDGEPYSNLVPFGTFNPHACNPVTEFPFTIDFEEVNPPNLPQCYLTENMGSGHNWKTSLARDNNFSSQVLSYTAHPEEPAKAWFFTRGFELQAGKKYSLGYSFGNDKTETTEKLHVSMGKDPSNDQMNTFIAAHDTINQGRKQMAEHIFEVPETGVYYFGFLALSDANQGHLFLDDIYIEETPHCLRPNKVTVDQIEKSKARITWNDENSASSYRIIYGAHDFNPDEEGKILESVEREIILTDLMPGTNYDVYIQSQCDDNEASPLSFVTHFSTSCEIQTLPYSLDFTNAVAPNLPPCTTQINVGNGNTWETFKDTQIFNQQVLRYQADSTYHADVWFFTNGIELQADTYYDISYSFANSTENPNFFEKLKVGLGTGQQPENMEILADYPRISNGEKQNHHIIVSVPEDGFYYLGFNVYSNFMASDLYLNEIAIEPGPDCPPSANLYYSDLMHNAVHFSWESNESVKEWELTYGYYGFNPDENGIALLHITDQPETDINNLEAETGYQFYVRSVCNENTVSQWSEPKYVKTKSEPPVNNYLCNAIELEINASCSTPYSNVGAFSEPDEPTGACFTYPGKTVWFKFTAPENGKVSIKSDFINDALVSQISVFKSVTNCDAVGELEPAIACAGFSANIDLTDLEPGEEYWIQVAANANQEGEFCIEVTEDNDLSTAENPFDQIAIYPNPVSHELNIQSQFPIEEISIYNLSGQLQMQMEPSSAHAIIAVEKLSSGVYFIKAKIGNKEKVFKVVKN